jgi:hypothetical protein
MNAQHFLFTLAVNLKSEYTMNISFSAVTSSPLYKKVLLPCLLLCIPFQLFAAIETKLDNSQADTGDRFGKTVSIDASGSIMAVGAPAGFIGSDGAGAVHIFEQIGESWVLQQKLLPDDSSPEDFFSSSVALSPDGNYLVVGNYSDDTACPADLDCNSGAAYVFARIDNSWVQQQKLVASDLAADSVFGLSVAISEGGNYIIIGAPRGGALTPTGTGVAYIFRWNGTSWVEQKKIHSNTGSTNNLFSWSVSMNSNADVLAIGDPDDNSACLGASDCNAGAVSIFVKDGLDWVQQGLFTGSDSNALGKVAVSLDGNYIVAGANFIWSGSGYAQIYKRNNGNWSLQDTLTSSDGDSGSWYANSLSINGDGSRIVVGAIYADVLGGEEGAAYLYQRSGDSWAETEKIVASDAAYNDEFGVAVALNSKGDKVVIGAQNKDSFETDFPYRGAAYLFTLQPSLGGSADAMTINTVICVNRTTGQRVRFQSNSSTWNCEEKGLSVSPGDQVLMSVSGVSN